MIGIATANWIAAFIFASFASVLFLGSKKESTRTYALVALCATGWVIGLGAYFFVDTPFWMVFWNRYNHVLAGLISVAFFYFSLLVPSERHPSKKILIGLGLIELLFLYAYFYTDIIIADSAFLSRIEVSRYPELFYAVGPIFYLHFFAFFAAGFINIKRKLAKETNPLVIIQFKYLLWGTIIGVIPPILADIILPRLGVYDFYSFAGMLTLGWIAFSSYAIARHQLFNVRLVLTSIAASAILSIAGILVVDLSSSRAVSIGMIGHTALFLAFLIVGVFLIYSLIHAEKRKKQLETLRKKLATLNETLIGNVRERSQHLNQEEQHAEYIIEHLTDGLVELDSSFKIVRINPAAEMLLGVTKEHVLGTFVDPHDTEVAQREALARITYPGSVGQKVAYSNKQGLRAAITEVTVHHPYERELEVATITFGSITTGTGYIKVIRDITAEKELSHNKSAFITTAAHRLRTPLSSINWALGAFIEGDLGRLNKKQKEIFTQMHSQNAGMIRLVNELLNTAHLEEGLFGFSWGPTNINEIVTNIVSLVAAEAKEKEVTITTELNSSSPITADSNRLKEALENVIDNAISYTNPGGNVTISTSQNEKTTTITVKDTGVGVESQEQPHVFEKFYRGKAAKKIRQDGSGIGLFIVKNVIESHQGKVTIESVPKKGTKITITLPNTR